MDRLAPELDSRRNPLAGGGRQERAVLEVLVECRGRVVGRRDLARRSGLADLNERRCDSVLVQLRRELGPNSIITVRRRGWMLAEHAVAAAQELLTHEGGPDDPLRIDHEGFEERGERAS